MNLHLIREQQQMISRPPQGNGGATSNLAAVDVLAQIVGQTVRVLDDQIDSVLAETNNFLRGAQNELETLSRRIEAARSEVMRTRDQWQKAHTASKPNIDVDALAKKIEHIADDGKPSHETS